MSGFRAMLAASMVLALGGCALMGDPPERVSYQRRPVSFRPTAARDWLDQYRESKGLSAVAIDPRLTAFAQAQAGAMAAGNVLSHTIGGSFSSRVKAAGLDDSRIAENVSYGTYTDGDAMRQWKNSPGHNENLLMPGATRFGIAIAQANGRVWWAMAISTEPVKQVAQSFGEGPVVRVRRFGASPPGVSMPAGLFGN